MGRFWIIGELCLAQQESLLVGSRFTSSSLRRWGDYEAFDACWLTRSRERPMRLCAYCVMPNHWHLLVWPERDGDLGEFMQRLTITPVRRWQEHRHQVGLGHVYQGRYKWFPVEEDAHFLAVARYVERNCAACQLGLSRGGVALVESVASLPRNG